MLFAATSVIDFLGAVAAFWLALYLPGRSFPGRVIWRAVGLLLCLSLFFLLEYVSLYAGSAAQFTAGAVLLVTALAAWNDLVRSAQPEASYGKASWRVGAIYLFAALTALVLLGAPGTFAEPRGSALWLPEMERQPPLGIYAAFLLCACASILVGCWTAERTEASTKYTFLQLASLVISGAVAYGLAASALAISLPRAMLDALILASVVLLAMSVARSEVLSRPRAPLRNLPVSAVAAVCLSVVYVLFAWRLGVAAVALPLAAGLAILTHSAYDRVLDLLERWKTRDQGAPSLNEDSLDPENGTTAAIDHMDPEFVSLVELGLRNLTDCIELGRSSLPSALQVHGETHIELGKAVQQRLLQAIEALRPAQGLGKNPPPRDCYSYIVLHDAYWECTPNRDIMSRLQISEGTFHRTRRAAVRAVARSLLEERELHVS